MNKLKSLYTAAIERPIYEKILFFVCLFSVIGTMIYYICAVPYIGNTETFMNFLYAKECIRAKELLSTEFIYRNDINYIPLNLLYIIPALISDSNAFCCIFIGAVMVFAGSAAVIYCSRKVSGNNCWLIYLPILWCGFCAGYIKFMFRLPSYLFLTLLTFLIYALVSTGVDDTLSIKSRTKFIISAVLIMVMSISGLRQIQTFTIPVVGGLVLYFIIEHWKDKGFSQTLQNKSLLKLIVAVAIISVSSAVGFLTFKILVKADIFQFVTTSQGDFFVQTNVSDNLHNLIKYFMQICGIKQSDSLFTLGSLLGLFKVAFNILMLIVFPILAFVDYKKETASMKLYMLISAVHVAEILVLSLFTTALSEERYIYSSIMLLYYLSAHYVYNHLLKPEANLGIKSLICVFAVIVFAVPGSVSLASSAANYTNNVKGSRVVTDFLQSKGLTYGYGTYWNSDNLTAYSDLKVRVCKVSVDDTVRPHKNLSFLHDYSEEAYQGKTFLLLRGSENDTFLAGKSYAAFGEPLEVCEIGSFTVYIYDYNIANNDFGGLVGDYSGIELEQIDKACRENEINYALEYEDGHIISILKGDTNNLSDIDADASVLLVTRDFLSDDYKMLDTAVGDFNLYICKMSELELTPSDSRVFSSDFKSDLDKWIVGNGETATYSNGALTVSCTKESDRRFNREIVLDEEYIGKPMTLCFKVSDINGYVITRAWGEDFKADRYISEKITEPGIYCYSFVPTSATLTIQPVLPEKLGNSAVIEWVWLE